MLLSRSIHRQQNVNKNIEPNKEPFFSKQSDADKPHQQNTFFQAKFSVNKPGDKYEQEADAVAGKVVNKTAHNNSIVQQKEISSIQRLSTEEEKPSTNDGRMAMDKEIQEMPIQRNRDAEKEKEKMGSIQKCSCNNGEPVQKMDEQEEEKNAVQTKAENNNSTVSDAVSSKINNTKGNGGKLSKNVNNEMSSSIGADFSNVKIHTNSNSISMNKELNAQAFTHGNDIYFNEGKFNPATAEGKFLLAHELTHVVQQGAAGEMTTQKKSNNIQLQTAPTTAPTVPGAGTTACGKPASCPAEFCEPFFSTTVAEVTRNQAAPILLAGIAAAVSPRVVPLWSQYIFGGAAPQNISATFGADFTTSLTTAATTTFLVDSLRAELTSSPPTFPAGQNMMVIDIATTIPAAITEIGTDRASHEMNFNAIGEIPGNIAGGIGTTQTSCPIGARPSPFNDSRTASGQAILIKNGNTVTVIPNILYEVKDTIDLCPGNCGASIEQAATILLSKFEASGISGDVPFTVNFPSMPVAPFDITVPGPAPTPTPAVPTIGAIHASSLHIRQQPNLAGHIVGSYRNGEIVNINCLVTGQSIDGNDTWYQTDRGFISARYVNISGDAPSNC